MHKRIKQSKSSTANLCKINKNLKTMEVITFNAEHLLWNQLKDVGLITGVPCSFFKGMINAAINEGRYLPAVDEGAAIAIATGYQISSGKKALVLMQNSGVGNAVSPLTSLNYVFKEPLTLMVSRRGGENDEPQHELMGTVDYKILENSGVQCVQITDAVTVNHSHERLSFCYLVPKGTFTPVKLEERLLEKIPTTSKHVREPFTTATLSRLEAIRSIVSTIQDAAAKTGEKYVFIATTGFTGRELWSEFDSEHNLYMVGSMGCALPLGLGMAIGNPKVKVVVIDGDGALLMRTGSMGTVAEYNPSNLIHICLDNEQYSTTGGQSRGCRGVCWGSLAAAFGYHETYSVNTPIEICNAVESSFNSPNASFIHIPIVPGNAQVGRPDKKPFEVKERLINYLRK